MTSTSTPYMSMIITIRSIIRASEEKRAKEEMLEKQQQVKMENTSEPIKTIGHFSYDILRSNAIKTLELADPRNNKDYHFSERCSTDNYLVYHHKNTSRTWATIDYDREQMIKRIIIFFNRCYEEYQETGMILTMAGKWFENNLFTAEYNECYKGIEYFRYETEKCLKISNALEFLTKKSRC